MKTKGKSCSIGSDRKLNTLETADDMGRIEPAKPGDPVGEDEVDEAAILVNPDPESMDSRG